MESRLMKKMRYPEIAIANNPNTMTQARSVQKSTPNLSLPISTQHKYPNIGMLRDEYIFPINTESATHGFRRQRTSRSTLTI
ncbi:hypothetical protein BCEP27_340002 [Burkholderia cepacia]